MESVDVAVVGAGVIGLSIARRLHLSGRRCIVLEKNLKCGMETSSRNSEVIHSGVYYPTSSSKSKHCITGRRMLINYMQERNIFHNMCGKLIIGHDEDDRRKLLSLFENGRAAGLHKLKFLSDTPEIAIYEPNLTCNHAIYSPYTGIMDSHDLMENFQLDITSQNIKGETSVIATNCMFLEADWTRNCNANDLVFPPSFEVFTSRGNFKCDWLINCAGLNSSAVAQRIQPLPKIRIPKLYFGKGSYFCLRALMSPFRRLVYPLPSEGGLGIHSTIDKVGNVRFGPDIEWLPDLGDLNPGTYGYKFDYTVAAEKEVAFKAEIAKYWPEVLNHELSPDYSGIRVKLSNTASSDFSIQTAGIHGVSRLINLFGIESPGLTSCLSIAEEVNNIIMAECE